MALADRTGLIQHGLRNHRAAGTDGRSQHVRCSNLREPGRPDSNRSCWPWHHGSAPKYSYTKVVPGFYNQIAPQEQGNEYVFTNGIDFGVEIKY